MGGQWGSEGKGLFAGYMAMQRKPDAVVSQFGPNAGHTWYEGDRPLVFKSLPVASVAKSVDTIFLGPGSVIDPEILERELETMHEWMDNKNIYVHEAAAIIMPGDKSAERAGVAHIASTMQGTSEAMIRKIRRLKDFPSHFYLKHLHPQVEVVIHAKYMQLMAKTETLQIEGSQGMDLSINSGVHYPYVTSRDCTPAQVLADCAVHPRDLGAIYACIRTFPIRVGHVVDAQGLRIGNSGPCYSDQKELTWDEVGQKEEYTTVTKRVRRVFTFSFLQTKKLLDEVRPTGIFLNFANYLQPPELFELQKTIDVMAKRPIVRWTGHGPRYTDIVEYHTKLEIKPPIYQE
jgi:adenylosuccinate synthase